MRKKAILGIGFGRFIFTIAAIPLLIACGILTRQPWYGVLLAVYSVIALMYLAEGKRAGPICGMFYCLAYGALFFSRQTYGLAVFNTFFGFPVYLGSVIAWGRHMHNGAGQTVKMKKLSIKGWALSLGTSVAVFVGIYLLLRHFHSENALFDSLSLSFAGTGLALLLLRYVENWCFYLVGNFVVLLLWIVNTAKDIASLNFVLIAALAVTISAIGFVTWLKLERKENHAAVNSLS